MRLAAACRAAASDGLRRLLGCGLWLGARGGEACGVECLGGIVIRVLVRSQHSVL